MDHLLSDIGNIYKKIDEYEIVNYTIKPYVTIKAAIYKKLDEDYYQLRVSHLITLPGTSTFKPNSNFSANSLEQVYMNLRYYFVFAKDSKKVKLIDQE
ncbi:MAG: hypothetical protein R2798_13190 [Chitinophagales bacterium]|nr:hypothetical protein [Bacteroidota bacterium]